MRYRQVLLRADQTKHQVSVVEKSIEHSKPQGQLLKTYCQTLLCLPRTYNLDTVTSHVLCLAGGQQQLSSLQQRLDTLSQGQAKLGLDIMALKANASPAPVSSLEANSGSQPEQQAANGGSSQTADSKSKVDTGSTADTGSAADSSTAGAYGNVQPNPALAGGIVIQRLDTLAAEVG